MKEYVKKFMATQGYPDAKLHAYGSQIYGTAHPSSDYDFYLVMPSVIEDQVLFSVNTPTGHKDVNITFITQSHFQDLVSEMHPSALEICIHDHLPFTLNLPILRQSFSQKASNSWVKCKKKLRDSDILKNEHQDPTYPTALELQHIGLKSLFHSLRILDFGIQLATTHTINLTQLPNLNTSCSELWQDILQTHSESPSWDYLQQTYKTQYNALHSKFREAAPLSSN